jgi:hypothetical protein
MIALDLSLTPALAAILGFNTENNNTVFSTLCAVGYSDFGLFLLQVILVSFIKNNFFNVEQFLPDLTFYPPKKVTQTLIRVENKISSEGSQIVSKEVQFCAGSKKVHNSCVKRWQ